MYVTLLIGLIYLFEFFLLNHNVENLFPFPSLGSRSLDVDWETDIDFDRPNLVVDPLFFLLRRTSSGVSCLKRDSTEEDDTGCFLPDDRGRGGFGLELPPINDLDGLRLTDFTLDACRDELMPRLPLGLGLQ